jgi:hypothetical protein
MRRLRNFYRKLRLTKPFETRTFFFQTGGHSAVRVTVRSFPPLFEYGMADSIAALIDEKVAVGGGVINLQRGTYIMATGNPIEIPDHITIVGRGKDTTTLKFDK